MKLRYWVFGAFTALAQMSLFSAPMSSDNQQMSSNEEKPGPAEAFEGIDLSAGLGYSGVTLMTTRSGSKPTSNTYYGGDGVAVQLKLGGHYAFGGMGLIGIEAYGQYNSAETKNKFYETTTSTTETNRHFKMEWNLGLDARLGYSPIENTLMFIFGGADWAYYDFIYNTPGLTSSFKDWKVGGALGAGLEQVLCEGWTLRSTFDYRWYPKKTLNYPNGEVQTIEPRLATALFMLGYTF